MQVGGSINTITRGVNEKEFGDGCVSAGVGVRISGCCVRFLLIPCGHRSGTQMGLGGPAPGRSTHVRVCMCRCCVCRSLHVCACARLRCNIQPRQLTWSSPTQLHVVVCMGLLLRPFSMSLPRDTQHAMWQNLARDSAVQTLRNHILLSSMNLPLYPFSLPSPCC